ncbi:AraC family transcriptional regulator [Paenibacillus swuensis]|nr:AraC family transcriptional regulator [Paenibacillus swuensis]
MNTIRERQASGMVMYRSSDYLQSPEFPFHMDKYEIRAGQFVEEHSHEFIEFVFIAGGRGIHRYQQEEYTVAKGDVFVIGPGVAHGYRVDAGDTLEVYNLLLEPPLLSGELEALFKVTPFVNFFYVEPFLRKTVEFQSRLTLDAAQIIELQYLIGKIKQEYLNQDAGYQVLTKTMLIELFIFLSRIYDRNKKNPLAALTDEGRLFQQVCEFIRMHHMKPLTLTQASQMCGYSPSAFSAKFKQHTGKTFVEYRNEIRLNVAGELLKGTELKILDIALKVGIDDLSYFNRMFRGLFGVTPGVYRRDAGN